jgi:IS30 family transposase
MLDHGYSKRAIADYIGCHRSSVYRELTKFSIDGKYCYQVAQEQASRNMARHRYKGPPDTIIQMIEARIINDQWSPEQISNWLKKHGYAHVSHTWI